MKENIIFNETSWQHIDSLLPEDENIKLAVLQDFVWFFNRTKRYKSNRQTIDDYIHHLELKANSPMGHRLLIDGAFSRIDIGRIKLRLLEIYG